MLYPPELRAHENSDCTRTAPPPPPPRGRFAPRKGSRYHLRAVFRKLNLHSQAGLLELSRGISPSARLTAIRQKGVRLTEAGRAYTTPARRAAPRQTPRRRYILDAERMKEPSRVRARKCALISVASRSSHVRLSSPQSRCAWALVNRSPGISRYSARARLTILSSTAAAGDICVLPEGKDTLPLSM